MFLNCHTVFSFKYGTMHPGQLLREAVRCGVRRFAVTEINNTASIIEMIRLTEEMRRSGDEEHVPDLAAGVEFRDGHRLLFIALARNQDGFEEISTVLSGWLAGRIRLHDRAPEFRNAHVIYPSGPVEPGSLHEHEFIGIRRHELNRFRLLPDRDRYAHKFVAWHPVTFRTSDEFEIHRLLRAIDLNTLLTKLKPSDTAREDERMAEPGEFLKWFEDFPGLAERAQDLLQDCTTEFALGKPKNKAEVTGAPESDWHVLVIEARKGFERKYPERDAALEERFERELRIIREKDFCAYYLIAWDLIRFAEANGFDHIGRGSGANSMVAWCLDITNVDPVELDLYFERFLNPERSSPPDFDLDFAWDQRDAIYDYLFRRYGPDHICLLGTHTTLQERSVVRELGKVYGLPKEEIDQLADRQPETRHRDHITEKIWRYAGSMKDLPVNISIHAGGVLITEAPVRRWTATTVPPKGYPVSHIDMHHAEDAGIYKFDILSQRGLGHLREAVRLVRENRGEVIDLTRHRDFQQDEAIKRMLREGKTIGCFYVESPAMRMLLRKLRCQDYRSLVAASSIIRPGVARSGMMRAYIERFHLAAAGKPFPCIHPKIGEILAETFGVMVYQEDVIRVAHLFAGLTLAEADILRRGMSGKFRSRREFERIREKFFSNCRDMGYDPAVTERVWFEIESFSGYSFAKGHSASYAVESYQSLYLKAHHPLEFMVGVINNFGGFYRTEFYFHEARMAGGETEPPCVQNSRYRTTIRGKTIYTGFIHVRSLETGLARRIEEERALRGPYRDLQDFVLRVSSSPEQLRILIRCGAFRFTGKTKQQLLWEALIRSNEVRTRPSDGTGSLFPETMTTLSLPELERHPLEDVLDEVEWLGFPLQNPFVLLRAQSDAGQRAEDIPSRTGQRVELIGYLVTTKPTWTADRKAMFFGTFIDREGAYFDTVHFPPQAARFPFRGRGFYRLNGKVSEEFGVHTIEVDRMEKLPMQNVSDEWLKDEYPMGFSDEN